MQVSVEHRATLGPPAQALGRPQVLQAPPQVSPLPVQQVQLLQPQGSPRQWLLHQQRRQIHCPPRCRRRRPPAPRRPGQLAPPPHCLAAPPMSPTPRRTPHLEHLHLQAPRSRRRPPQGTVAARPRPQPRPASSLPVTRDRAATRLQRRPPAREVASRKGSAARLAAGGAPRGVSVAPNASRASPAPASEPAAAQRMTPPRCRVRLRRLLGSGCRRTFTR